jgi:aminoglycoside 6'-N-acetyltransferase
MQVPLLRGERVTLRPLSEEELDELAAIVASPGVREWWAWRAEDDPGQLREELRNEGGAFAIEVDKALAGWLGFTEQADAAYRHAALDIILAPPYQDRALGSEALRTAIRWFVDHRGHHRFTIDPALHNQRAIRAYEAVGFRRVGVLRRYERGTDGLWHDNLLMDLLTEDLEPYTARPPEDRR